jgi:hypothetical protein
MRVSSWVRDALISPQFNNFCSIELCSIVNTGLFSYEQCHQTPFISGAKNNHLFCGIISGRRAKTYSMKSILLSATLLLSLTMIREAYAQQNDDLTRTILSLDSVFWQAYNRCDVEKMETFFTKDVEFYHDKGGLTVTADSLFKSIRKGLCGNENWRLRREVIPGTLKVYPLNNYGAILSGEHLFYINEKGKEEHLDGIARFTHVWRFSDNQWKMHRVLSYDHGPASERIGNYPQLKHLTKK